ncbi:MAG: hypothetical protein COB51_10765 [Moraxellaceae bacterium]|nr:MAG: hypothetical protein COB51_10765 [Moraxellaceae bacterium]
MNKITEPLYQFLNYTINPIPISHNPCHSNLFFQRFNSEQGHSFLSLIYYKTTHLRPPFDLWQRNIKIYIFKPKIYLPQKTIKNLAALSQSK